MRCLRTSPHLLSSQALFLSQSHLLCTQQPCQAVFSYPLLSLLIPQGPNKNRKHCSRTLLHLLSSPALFLSQSPLRCTQQLCQTSLSSLLSSLLIPQGHNKHRKCRSRTLLHLLSSPALFLSLLPFRCTQLLCQASFSSLLLSLLIPQGQNKDWMCCSRTLLLLLSSLAPYISQSPLLCSQQQCQASLSSLLSSLLIPQGQNKHRMRYSRTLLHLLSSQALFLSQSPLLCTQQLCQAVFCYSLLSLLIPQGKNKHWMRYSRTLLHLLSSQAFFLSLLPLLCTQQLCQASLPSLFLSLLISQGKNKDWMRCSWTLLHRLSSQTLFLSLSPLLCTQWLYQASLSSLLSSLLISQGQNKN